MNPTKVFLPAISLAVAIGLPACATGSRVVGREQSYQESSQVVSRGSASTSDEDLRELRGGRERLTSDSVSSTSVNRSGKVKAQSSDTEVIDSVSETVVDMVPVASGDESLR
jgi:hypothetical protein